MTEVTITVRSNGPYKVVGPVTIVDLEGRRFELPEGGAIALCRCGHSRDKPFCDASHRRVGFVADDSAPRVRGGRQVSDGESDT
ncbi:MAG TPA: CDGSH iron-sulfur domain-containing protein [Gaiella sp.]|nr:CDGSH iron-sulfur domain-containing protein [Gaiella sp.]